MSKGPKIVIDFADELVRQLTAGLVEATLREYIANEASVDVKTAAEFLGLSETDFRRKAKKIPVINYGERSARYTLADLREYRDKNRTIPKK